MARTLDSGTNRKSKGTEMKRWTMSAVLALTTAWGVAAQAAYPDRPCGWWCRSAPGHHGHRCAPVGKGLGDALGQPVVVENRPGAGGVIAAQLAASAPADGYTIFMGTVGTQVVNPLIYRKLAYDADSYVPLGWCRGRRTCWRCGRACRPRISRSSRPMPRPTRPSSISVRPGRQARRIWGWSC